MRHNLPGRINEDIFFIDYMLQRQQQIDRAAIERMRERRQVAQVWGHTLPACPAKRIVEGSISEVHDTGGNNQ